MNEECPILKAIAVNIDIDKDEYGFQWERVHVECWKKDWKPFHLSIGSIYDKDSPKSFRVCVHNRFYSVICAHCTESYVNDITVDGIMMYRVTAHFVCQSVGMQNDLISNVRMWS